MRLISCERPIRNGNKLDRLRGLTHGKSLIPQISSLVGFTGGARPNGDQFKRNVFAANLMSTIEIRKNDKSSAERSGSRNGNE